MYTNIITRSKKAAAKTCTGMLLAIGLIVTSQATAQSLPPKSTNIIDYKRLAQVKQTSNNMGSAIYSAKDSVLDVVTLQQPDFIYRLGARIPLKKQDIQKGQVVLLRYDARTVSSGLETGEARVNWVLHTTKEVKDRVDRSMSISSTWSTYFVPLLLPEDADPKHLALMMQHGFPPQQFLLKNIQLWVCPKGTKIENLPKTRVSYQGIDANAAWRKKAHERIEQYRKGNIDITFLHNGAPLQDATVQIKLKRHLFNWGAAVQAQSIVEEPGQLDRIAKLFNTVVFENDLKIKHWKKNQNHAAVLQAMKMLEERQIAIKGHALIWPGFKYLTREFEANSSDPAKIKKMLDEHMTEIIAATKGKISRWDVVNEAYTNTDLQTITGSEEILYDGFRKLQKADPKALRFVNEYGIISRGGIDKKKQQWYYDFVQRIDQNTSGLVDGIGMQSHIGYDLTPPERVLSILDFYAPLKKRIAISEFTMDVDDPVVREQYTRDFMIAAFSHPTVTDFLFWGTKGEKNDIFDQKNELGVMGRAFDQLVNHEWKTDLEGKTNEQGQCNGRGFYGTYSYSYTINGERFAGTFNLLPNVLEKIVVRNGD